MVCGVDVQADWDRDWDALCETRRLGKPLSLFPFFCPCSPFNRPQENHDALNDRAKSNVWIIEARALAIIISSVATDATASNEIIATSRLLDSGRIRRSRRKSGRQDSSSPPPIQMEIFTELLLYVLRADGPPRPVISSICFNTDLGCMLRPSQVLLGPVPLPQSHG
jgi:hypothetical protein